MNAPLPPISVEDRAHILRHTADLWPQLAGSRLFITGGTGFYGKWLLEAVAAANDELGVKVCATVLSRDPARFAAATPHLARRKEFDWILGEPASFSFPVGNFDWLIDFATPSAAEIAVGGASVIEPSLRGSENLLRFARSSGVRRLLYASSGAVYGTQPAGVERIAEDFVADPATLSAYGRLKHHTERQLLESGVDCVISRGFAFVGPYLPMTDKFAVGSFMRDALAGGPIHIRGHGSTMRSYLYAAELPIWLLTLLVRGNTGEAYNLGSESPVTLHELARIIAGCCERPITITIATAAMDAPSCYVPNLEKAAGQLGLTTRIDLEEAISRTLIWSQQ